MTGENGFLDMCLFIVHDYSLYFCYEICCLYIYPVYFHHMERVFLIKFEAKIKNKSGLEALHVVSRRVRSLQDLQTTSTCSRNRLRKKVMMGNGQGII